MRQGLAQPVRPGCIVPSVGGPVFATEHIPATVLTVVAGPDPADPVTVEQGAGRVREDYRKYLDLHGLRGARIGVFREYIETKTTDPEVKAVTEGALAELKAQGAVLVDPFTIPEYEALQKDLWCGDFQADLNAYLAKHPNAPYHDLQAIVDSGLYLPYIQEEIKGSLAKPGPDERRSPCRDVYHDAPKVKFRAAVLAAMDREHLDAIVYPTWSNAPRKVGDVKSPAGDNSQVLSPQTGFPAMTVPMGFTHGDLPAGLTFLGRAFAEGELIRLAYSYEQATKHRSPPKSFPPL